jgi:hypothetical protein
MEVLLMDLLLLVKRPHAALCKLGEQDDKGLSLRV